MDTREALERAIGEYAGSHANSDGVAVTAVPGVRMMRVVAPTGPLHSVYRPLVCLILQGAKQMLVGTEAGRVKAGESVIVTADLPVSGHIVRASRREPYLALAIELDVPLLRSLDAELAESPPAEAALPSFVVAEIGDAALDSTLRLVRLLDRPRAVPLLAPGILRELHYWLLSGPHGAALRALALPDGSAGRLEAAIRMLRKDYRKRISVGRLAKAAAMGVTAFHAQFKRHTSLTPIQFQKRLRLIEARRLLVHEGFSATSAAFEVGYQSASQFTREYARLFGAPPKRDAQRARGDANSTATAAATGIGRD